MKFTLYPIYWLGDVVDDERFDLNQLPFDLTEGVRIEAVAGRFSKGTFDLFKAKLGTDIADLLEGVRYALVHRYDPESIVVDGQATGEEQNRESSEKLTRMLAACLRLIRPMRQHALLMRGTIRDDDGSFYVV